MNPLYPIARLGRLAWLAGLIVLLVGVRAGPLLAQAACNNPELEQNFSRQLREINFRIRERQEKIERMLADPSVPEEQIRLMAAELSNWRTRREQLAIAYILKQRHSDCPLPQFPGIRKER
ncbi:hypothetical protein [Gloeobacter kilaueensis]|uniref:Periplasmic heavy metal sensor n=1 Tax=Gloeobacter kilaueensis (strain ATCC BAA-2537 / CCAP 1431/1 / ULC 316 / JS1) TaxID=1183438 RepID=U5QLZ5_GLOK1|nr:hypothetical protein [Gloeobacter kilaueensis]AGY59931.1 hypothetical protein GKIL_3685 [Gloeobacter kilaueensis JS1]